MAVTHYLLTLLSVLSSSVSERGLACSAAITTLHQCVPHPTGFFLGDGVFYIEGLELGFSTFSNPSSQSEELHQQYVLPHLSQNSQYLPRNLFLSGCSSSSSSMFGTVAAHLGSVKTWGGYLNPWPTGTSVLDVLPSVCMFVTLWGAFLFLVLTLLLPSAFSQAWHFSVLVWMSWSMLNFPNIVLTFISNSRAPVGILQNKYPSRMQAVFGDLLSAILK